MDSETVSNLPKVNQQNQKFKSTSANSKVSHGVLLASQKHPEWHPQLTHWLLHLYHFLATGKGVSRLSSLPSWKGVGAAKILWGHYACVWGGKMVSTNTHTTLSHLPSSFRGEDGRQELPSQNLHGHSSHTAQPSCPSVPFSGEWDAPRNRVTESAVG